MELLQCIFDDGFEYPPEEMAAIRSLLEAAQLQPGAAAGGEAAAAAGSAAGGGDDAGSKSGRSRLSRQEQAKAKARSKHAKIMARFQKSLSSSTMASDVGLVRSRMASNSSGSLSRTDPVRHSPWQAKRPRFRLLVCCCDMHELQFGLPYNTFPLL